MYIIFKLIKISAQVIQMTENGNVYCSFVETDVPRDKLNEYCYPFIGEDSRCTHCPKSPQIDMGMPVKDLIRQMRG